jgi:hypothetical protein
LSHFVRVQAALSNSRLSAIKSALTALGCQAEKIEIDEKGGLELKDYYGHMSGTKCAIRVKGSRWSNQNYGGNTDIGIEFTKAGDAILHVDGMYHGKDWQTKLTREYSKAVLKEVASETGFYLESEGTVDDTDELVFVNAF